MPKLNIDQFDESPNVGDKVRVMGKVESIDEDSGEVEVSYDDVKIVKEKRKKRDDEEEVVVEESEEASNSDSLDNALAQAFPNTQ